MWRCPKGCSSAEVIASDAVRVAQEELDELLDYTNVEGTPGNIRRARKALADAKAAATE